MIQDGSAHVIALQKIGSATLTLTGNNTYSAGTVVNGGTLLANNTTGSATGSGVVNVSAFATLGGNGTIGGTVSVAAYGILAPGNNLGTLTLSNDLSMDDAGTLQFEVGAASDHVSVGGDLTLGGTLNLGRRRRAAFRHLQLSSLMVARSASAVCPSALFLPVSFTALIPALPAR